MLTAGRAGRRPGGPLTPLLLLPSTPSRRIPLTGSPTESALRSCTTPEPGACNVALRVVRDPRSRTVHALGMHTLRPTRLAITSSPPLLEVFARYILPPPVPPTNRSRPIAPCPSNTTRVRNLFSKKSEHAGRPFKAARRRPILKVLLYARE